MGLGQMKSLRSNNKQKELHPEVLHVEGNIERIKRAVAHIENLDATDICIAANRLNIIIDWNKDAITLLHLIKWNNYTN